MFFFIFAYEFDFGFRFFVFSINMQVFSWTCEISIDFHRIFLVIMTIKLYVIIFSNFGRFFIGLLNRFLFYWLDLNCLIYMFIYFYHDFHWFNYNLTIFLNFFLRHFLKIYKYRIIILRKSRGLFRDLIRCLFRGLIRCLCKILLCDLPRDLFKGFS